MTTGVKGRSDDWGFMVEILVLQVVQTRKTYKTKENQRKPKKNLGKLREREATLGKSQQKPKNIFPGNSRKSPGELGKTNENPRKNRPKKPTETWSSWRIKEALRWVAGVWRTRSRCEFPVFFCQLLR